MSTLHYIGFTAPERFRSSEEMLNRKNKKKTSLQQYESIPYKSTNQEI